MARENEIGGNLDKEAGFAGEGKVDGGSKETSEGNKGAVEKTNLIYIALLHYLIKKRDGSLGFTSITNLDIHDIARLSRTFEIGKFFVVSPVESQKEHASAIIKHWTEGFGSTYNRFRREAFEKVELKDTLEDCVEKIKKDTGKKPVIIGTAAKRIFNKIIDYSDVYDKMLSAGFPVLLVFGTGWGLHEEAAEKCHYFLEPIEGVAGYNHLSVRSAVTIVLDRIVRKILYKESRNGHHSGI